jgi:hypothetical protein
MLQASMMDRIKRSKFKKIIAIFLIVFGGVALITPGIPGAWLAIIGLEILGIRILWVESLRAKWIEWRTKRKANQ